MAVTANSIITPQTPKSGAVQVSSANTNYETPSALGTALVTAGANGARVTRITAIPVESTAGVGVLQIYRDLAGATKYLQNVQANTNDTVSSTDAPILIDFGYTDDNPLILQAGEHIYPATSIAKKFVFIAEWADY